MREQLFHAWRSFHYDENVETPDAYVIRIKQVARLLGYEDLQVLEVFKNTVPNRLYWVLFSIDNLREAVETAKRFLTKEKIDRQMTGQIFTPFMKLSDKKIKSVTFETKEALERTSENMEMMMMLMDKMYIKLEQKDVPYKPQIYQRGRGQNWRQFNRGSNWRGYRSSIKVAVKATEGMEEVEVTLGEEYFKEEVILEVVFEVDIMIIGLIEIGKIEDCGDNLGPEKEKEGVGHHLVLDQVPELVLTEIGLGVLNAGNMITLQINVLIRHLTVQIVIVIVQDQHLYIWLIVIQDRIWITI